jgi:hypothetical protein
MLTSLGKCIVTLVESRIICFTTLCILLHGVTAELNLNVSGVPHKYLSPDSHLFPTTMLASSPQRRPEKQPLNNSQFLNPAPYHLVHIVIRSICMSPQLIPFSNRKRTLVLDYLCHSCYTSTARVFARDSTVRQLDADGDEIMSPVNGIPGDDATILTEEVLRQVELRERKYLHFFIPVSVTAFVLLSRYTNKHSFRSHRRCKQSTQRTLPISTRSIIRLYPEIRTLVVRSRGIYWTHICRSCSP